MVHNSLMKFIKGKRLVGKRHVYQKKLLILRKNYKATVCISNENLYNLNIVVN